MMQVLECWDRKRKDYVAVKIIRNIQVGGQPVLTWRTPALIWRAQAQTPLGLHRAYNCMTPAGGCAIFSHNVVQLHTCALLCTALDLLPCTACALVLYCRSTATPP